LDIVAGMGMHHVQWCFNLFNNKPPKAFLLSAYLLCQTCADAPGKWINIRPSYTILDGM
jgi:hypothetical protein